VVRLVSRKMLGEQLAGSVNSMDDSFGELSLPKQLAHGSGDVLPKRLPTLGVHCRVSQDREVLRFRRDENQDRIAMLGFVHAQLHELVRTGMPRVGDFAMAHIHTNLPRRAFLHLLNGCGNSVVVQCGK